jgi:prophage DNA circulation protein
MPAAFRGQQFHCESNSVDNGRHIVEHEFPKRDLPYGEDMGRRAKEFTVRGYCIVYPANSNQPLYQRDYRTPRNNLLRVLEDGQPGVLQLPTLPPIMVVCSRYRLTEEERLGGYCMFDMTFLEYGIKPTSTAASTMSVVNKASQTAKQRVLDVLKQGTSKVPLPRSRPPTAPGGSLSQPPPSSA